MKFKEKKRVKKPKENTGLSKEEYQDLVASGHADLIPESLVPKDSVKREPKVLTPAQLARVEGRQSAWLCFKFALIFRVWKEITGEMPHKPNTGVFDWNGRPKDGTPPQEWIINHLSIAKPLTKPEYRSAYAVIAEMYAITPDGVRPDGNLWKSLVENSESLIKKWLEPQDPLFEMPFPDALKTARMEKRWTQGELADEIDYQSLAVSRWERAEYEPSAQAIYEIAKRLPRMRLWFQNNKEWVKAHGVPGI